MRLAHLQATNIHHNRSMSPGLAEELLDKHEWHHPLVVPSTLDPQPITLHPQPSTLSPQPYTVVLHF